MIRKGKKAERNRAIFKGEERAHLKKRKRTGGRQRSKRRRQWQQRQREERRYREEFAGLGNLESSIAAMEEGRALGPSR